MVTNALIIHNKTKGKTKQKGLFCRIEIYYWILPNKKSNKDCDANIQHTQKFRTIFSNFKV